MTRTGLSGLEPGTDRAQKPPTAETFSGLAAIAGRCALKHAIGRLIPGKEKGGAAALNFMGSEIGDGPPQGSPL